MTPAGARTIIGEREAPDGATLEVCLPNLHDLFAAPDLDAGPRLPHAAAHKAAVWAEHPGAWVLAPRGSRRLHQGVVDLGLACPVRTFEDKVPAIRIRDALRPGPLSLVLRAAVHSGTTADIAAVLDAEGLGHAGIPPCSAGRVRLWNTKTGGRDLLLSVPDVAEKVPASVVAHGLDQAAAIVACRRPGDRLFVKNDFGAGGSGVVPVVVGKTRLRERLNSLQARIRDLDVKLRPSWEGGEAILIQEAVGPEDPRQALSITADFHIDPPAAPAPARVALVGMGRQILEDGVLYRGVRWHGGLLDRPTRTEIGAIGTAVGERMASLGYHGPFNLDMLVDGPGCGRIWLLEINVRRSAPLDQFLIARRVWGADWMDNPDAAFAGFESALAPQGGWQDLKDSGRLLGASAAHEGLLPLADPDPETRRWPLMALARTPEALAGLERTHGAPGQG